MDLEEERRKGIRKLAQNLYDALAIGDTKQIEEKKKQLVEAMKSVYSSDIPPSRKFVIIFSSAAGEIERAIADFSEDQKTTDALLKTIAAFKREEFIEAKVEEEDAELALKFLKKIKVEVEKALSENLDLKKAQSLLESVVSIRLH